MRVLSKNTVISAWIGTFVSTFYLQYSLCFWSLKPGLHQKFLLIPLYEGMKYFKPMTNSTYKVAMMRIIGLLRTSFLLKMRDLRVLSYKLKSNAISAGCGTFVSGFSSLELVYTNTSVYQLYWNGVLQLIFF